MHPVPQEAPMTDLLYLGIVAGFCLLSWGFIRLADKV